MSASSYHIHIGKTGKTGAAVDERSRPNMRYPYRRRRPALMRRCITLTFSVYARGDLRWRYVDLHL